MNDKAAKPFSVVLFCYDDDDDDAVRNNMF